MLEDLNALKKEQDKATSSHIRKKAKEEASKRATNKANSSTTCRVMDKEIGDCIVVKLRVN